MRDSLTTEFVVVFVFFPLLNEYSEVFYCFALEPVSTTKGLYVSSLIILAFEGSENNRRCFVCFFVVNRLLELKSAL